MPISDNYVVQYLVQNTDAGDGSLVWRETEFEGYVASLNDIKIEFGCAPGRTGARSFLTLSTVLSSIQIVEPYNVGIFRPKFANEDEERLAGLMKSLGQAIRRQCSARRQRETEFAGPIREDIYRRLLGTSPVKEFVSQAKVR